MRTLAEMNEDGVLSAFLPEWEHIFCRWQHVIYHIYTVDVHTLFLIEELRRLERGDYSDALAELTTLMQEVTDVPVLFLGCLLHDIGKGFGGDHSNLGAERALTCLERLGLSPERVERAVFLVRHHLLMSHIAQRRDLSDARLIVDFARTCGDRENLRNLYLLTFADIRASSATAWTDWKGQLLRELFERTSELLETGASDPGHAIELIERRVEIRRAAAAAELVGLGVADANAHAFFEVMPKRYFTAHTPRQIARHAMVVLGLSRDALLSMAIREFRADFSELIVYTKDRHGLSADVAGTLTAHGVNILGAHVYTTKSGQALEIYRVSTPEGGEEERRLLWDAFQTSLERVLRGDVRVAELLKRRRRPRRRDLMIAHAPTTASISNEESDFYTIVDVSANDRLGLLHDLTRTIADHGCEIYISKAAKIMDQVADSFYLKDADGKKLSDPQRIETLRVALLEAAQRDEETLGG
jgi:[protein-PII] uridylyltransferase